MIAKEIIKSLGIVFGDLSTSPIYIFALIFTLLPVTIPNVLGVFSLIIWTLITLVFIQYIWLAMSLNKKGEGGTIILKELLIAQLHSQKQKTYATILSFVAISFLIGDGALTPAMNILSAVEGFKLIPGLSHLNQFLLCLGACFIAAQLFTIQKRGLDRASVLFGPLMFIWFLVLGLSGAYWLCQMPTVLQAFNPLLGLNFLFNQGIIGFFLLSKIILCATGAESLYADMGHVSRKPLLLGWCLVFAMLVLNYGGQAAFLLKYHQSNQPFYHMVFHASSWFYIPFVLLSIVACAIASQAVITSIFALIYQGITTNSIPRLKIDYTSRMFKSQIYIPSVNRVLFCIAILAILGFQQSYKIAYSYGLAVSGSMMITAYMLLWIFYCKADWLKCIVSLATAIITTIFFAANSSKIPLGGYWSLIIAAIPLVTFIIYTLGRKKLHHRAQRQPLDEFLPVYKKLYSKGPRLHGTAIFCIKSIDELPAYIQHIIFINEIIYDQNILLLVKTKEQPFGVSALLNEEIAPGLQVLEIRLGYMEIPDVENVIKKIGLGPKVIFYGVEEIVTKNPLWHVFALIKKITPSFVQFYKLPYDKLHGVITQVKL